MTIGICLVAAYALLAWVYGPVRYKYRMTVEVRTPVGPRTGSAVQMLEWRPTLPLLAAGKFTTRQRGDAVAVDLPDGSTLFVLLSQDMVGRAFAQGQSTDIKTALDEAEPGKDYVYSPPPPRDNRGFVRLPTYVKFRDISAPASVYAVEPGDLGGGAAIHRITLRTTREPVTRTIHKWLPWLAKYKGVRLTGQRSIVAANADEGLAAQMGTGSFRIP